MNLFEHWEAKRHLSTMQNMQEELIALRRKVRINQAVAGVVWLFAAAVALYETFWRGMP